MEAVLIGERKKLVNLNFLNEVVDEAKGVIHGVENRINNTLNNILDDCFLGKTETVDYEEILSSQKEAYTSQSKYKKPSYRSRLEDICSGCSSKRISDVGEMLAGKYINAYSVKEKAPRRMWKWTDRIACIEDAFRNYSPNSEDSKYLSEMRSALKSNRYLRRKHRAIYDRLMTYF
jgi:hypothetical protein